MGLMVYSEQFSLWGEAADLCFGRIPTVGIVDLAGIRTSNPQAEIKMDIAADPSV
jgi:hypothetical protein